MFDNGFDAGNAFRHPVFLVTFIFAIPAWIIAFASQCAAEAKYSKPGHTKRMELQQLMCAGSGLGRTPVVGELWFAIWVQL